MNTVVAAGDCQGTAADNHRSIAVEGIVGRIHCKRAAFNQQAVAGLQTLHAGFGIRSGGTGTGGFTTSGATHEIAPTAGTVAVTVFVAAAGQNFHITAGNLQRQGRADTVTLGFDVQPAAGNIHKAGFRVVVVLHMQAIHAGIHSNQGILHPNTVVGIQRMGSRINGVSAAGENQIVLAHDTLACRRFHRQAACAVKGQILSGKYGAIHLGRQATTVDQTILGAFLQGHKDLVALLHIQSRRVGAGNVRAVQHQLNLILGFRPNDHATVVQLATKHKGAFRTNGHHSSFHPNCGGIAGNRVPIELNLHGLGFVVIRFAVPVGEHFLIGFGNIFATGSAANRRIRSRAADGGIAGSRAIGGGSVFQNTAATKQQRQNQQNRKKLFHNGILLCFSYLQPIHAN